MNNLTIKKTRSLLLLAYVAIFLWSFQTHGLPVARMAVLSWVAAAFVVGNIGQPKRKQMQMAGDLALYAAMWLSYDYSRGTADSLGFPLQVELPRNIDKFLFIGHDPNVWIQEHFWHREIRWYDVVGSLVYFTHFFVPVATSVYLWIRYRDEWVRYMRRFSTVLFAGVLTYIVAPTAPPWMAASNQFHYQILEPLQRTTGRGWSWLGLETVSSVLLRGQQWSNPTAALPSLHAAFALFVVVFFWKKFPRVWMRWTALLFPLAMAVTLVYFGEHYVTDIFVGWAYVAGSLWFWDRWESKRATHSPLASE